MISESDYKIYYIMFAVTIERVYLVMMMMMIMMIQVIFQYVICKLQMMQLLKYSENTYHDSIT